MSKETKRITQRGVLIKFKIISNNLSKVDFMLKEREREREREWKNSINAENIFKKIRYFFWQGHRWLVFFGGGG